MGTPKSLMIKVIVFAGEIVIREKIIDFYDLEKKKWLTSLIVWVTCNHYAMEIVNIEDDR